MELRIGWIMNKKTIIATVALVIAAIGILVYVYSGKERSPIQQQRAMVDVLTGQRQSVSGARVLAIPLQNSRGQESIFPVMQDDSGTWIIPERYQGLLLRLVNEGTLPRDGLKVDLETFAIQR